VIIGKSFIIPTLKTIAMKVGITHEVYSTYTTKQNGVVENQVLITLARTMLDEYDTPERFWAEAIYTTCNAFNYLFPH